MRRPTPIQRVITAKLRRAVAPSAPSWPTYTGLSTYVGTSKDGRVDVFVDPSLGNDGMNNAIDLVNDADRIAAANDAFFGVVGGSVQVIVFALDGYTDGGGGADHMGCDFTTGAAIEVCASFGQSMRVSGLLEAELSECSMNNNLCGLSTGECLSRWSAMIVSSNALGDFATGAIWFDHGMPDYVNTTDPTDQNPDSIGCGMAFISWLLSMSISFDEIAQTMVRLGDNGTLADLYNALSGDTTSNAWPKFQAAVQALSWGVTSDDPFNGMSVPQPPPGPVPSPGPAPAPGGPTLADAIDWAARGLHDNWPSDAPLGIARPTEAPGGPGQLKTPRATNPQEGPTPYRG